MTILSRNVAIPAALVGLLGLASYPALKSVSAQPTPPAASAAVPVQAAVPPAFPNNCLPGQSTLVQPVGSGYRVDCMGAASLTPTYPDGASLITQTPVAQHVTTRPVTRAQTRTRYVTRTQYVDSHHGRSWKKSAAIIGGSAAGGAGLGAIMGGGSGAKKGAVVGGVGGLVYDLATRNK